MSIKKPQAVFYDKLRKGMPMVHWQRIESGEIAQGIPDLNGCLLGREAWIELKIAAGGENATRFTSALTPLQANWLAARYSHGGNCFVGALKMFKKKTPNDFVMRFWNGGQARMVEQRHWEAPYYAEFSTHIHGGDIFVAVQRYLFGTA